MSPRTLGGGRVLGSAKTLSPAAPISSPQSKSHVLSPSASSLSLSSQASTSQLSLDTQDLTSRISLGNGETSISAPPAAVGSNLSCPICNEEMVTLLQLNRHLDDAHKNLEDDRQDEVKDWFKVQMVKAKRFQPLAVLNQKLRGLDVFESNENAQAMTAQSRPSATPIVIADHQPRPVDPDEVVTREHWQARGLYDTCLEPSCGKRLNATNGCINCRKCGKLFCEEHTMYQMKLSRSAQHDPVRGFWCRVCETCYKSREGYNDHNGALRDSTDDFNALRKQTVDRHLLDVSRLEKRLTRLTQLLASLPADQIQQGVNKRWSLTRQSDQRKALEQTIVSWQDDASVAKCPFCHQDFSGYSFRRHHCRTCGRVVCGDPVTGCSAEVPLSVSTLVNVATEKSTNVGQISVDVRLCKECKATLFDLRDFQADVMRKPPELKAYQNLIQFEQGIQLLLPRFQKLLTVLQDSRRPPSATQIAEASKVRKRLIDSFGQYNTAARRVRDLPTQSSTQQMLQKAIYQRATNFLHVHMLSLKSLPKILKDATQNERSPSDINTPMSRSPVPSAASHRRQESAQTSITYNSSASNGNNSSVPEDDSSLREQLIVLEEQKFLVTEMIAEANRRRKFDDVSSLVMNVECLTREIGHIKGLLSNPDFERLFSGDVE